MNALITHIGFADESNWNKGRFRSLGLVTAPIEYVQTLEDDIRRLLVDSGICEFKWKHLRGAKERFAAEELSKFTIEKACGGQLRVDVLIWDIEDSRHKIPKRDDVANLQRMYYHLFRNVLRTRWPAGSIWRLHPHEHTAIDWNEVEDYLDKTSVTVEIERSLFTGGRFRFRLKQEFGIEEIKPVTSRDHPLLQLADLFAGLAAFSHEKFDEYQLWLQSISPQASLFDEGGVLVNLSRSSRERFQVLKMFNDLCKQRKLHVSLETWKGLRTLNPDKPLNFWLYKSQHPDDKAPTRG